MKAIATVMTKKTAMMEWVSMSKYLQMDGPENLADNFVLQNECLVDGSIDYCQHPDSRYGGEGVV